MSDNCTILNAIQTEIVKYCDVKTLKKCYSLHDDWGELPPNIFTRNGRMTFSNLIKFLLYPRSKSSNVELLEYSHLIGKRNVNKSYFSRCRQYVPNAYLKELNKSCMSSIYGRCGISKWNGHLLLAGDGTTYSLPNTDAIKKKYLDGRKTGRSEQALARGVVLKDVLNDIVVSADMECYGKDEIKLLGEQLDNLPQEVLKHSPVVVLDRKYCAYTLIAKMMRMGIGFVIRVKSRFNSSVDDFILSDKSECELDISPASSTIKKLNRLYGKGDYSSFHVKLVRLSSDVVVMTSLGEGLGPDSAKSVYHERWNDETTIGFFKNCLQIEIFSGISDNALQQDFCSKLILYNVLSALCQQAAAARHDGCGGARRIDRNVALGILRLNALVALTGKPGCDKRNLQSVLNEISRFTVPIKEGRSNPRLFRKIKHWGKYITLYNYRRAI